MGPEATDDFCISALHGSDLADRHRAFRVLYDRYHAELEKTALNLAKGSGSLDGDDALSVVWMRLWLRPPQPGHGADSLLPYLRVVLHREFINQSRDRRRQFLSLEEASPRDCIDARPGPDEVAELADSVEDLRRQLDPDELALFELMCQGLTQREIIDRLGLPTSSVYRRVAFLKDKLFRLTQDRESD